MSTEFVATEEQAETTGAWVPTWVVPAAIAVLLVALLGLLIGLYVTTRTPGTNSAEAGFARDMSVHHAQAVEMAMIARDRTDDDQLRVVATDILLTQQNQIGRMEGWLTVWDLPMTGGNGQMSWMGHHVDGLMPGMATQEQVNELQTMPVDKMNIQFLDLMIVHHQAGVEMAQAILDRSDEPVVRDLAQSIIKTQANEIALMEEMLNRLGAPLPAGATGTPTVGEHQH
ncbi:MAG TPA: DUF305 domain-containing protein [Thermomicrobiales bacterium]|nr:DUF305 domain-containing protein [Thermomicrobiales bacterium]